MSLGIGSRMGVAFASTCFLLPLGVAQGDATTFHTTAPAQMRGDTAMTGNGWSVIPLVTIGEEGPNGEDVNLAAFGYRPVGILDGIAAFPGPEGSLRLLVNHELSNSAGYEQPLANGTLLKGGRISYVDIDTCTYAVIGMGAGYDTVYDRTGAVVTMASQINEGFNSGGFDRLCSSTGFLAGEYGIADDVYFAGEEVGEFGSTPATGMGGQQVVVDVDNGDAYVLPMLGRGAWESSTLVENFGTNKIVVLWGDDREGAPMWLYIGEREATPPTGAYTPPEFLVRNGLGFGYLFAWKADNGDTTPQQFNGTGSVRTGTFVRVNNYDPSLADLPHWDALGFASLSSLDSQSQALGGFRLSRPEDVATNPADGTQVVHASTGRGTLFPADNWGTIYVFDFEDAALKAALEGDLDDIDNLPCTATILYDCDDAGDQFEHPDLGIRSPDNLDWADDGFIYVQEDKSTSPGSLFGSVSGAEASMWRLDPKSAVATRLLEMDRSAVPFGQFDPSPNDVGNWESSGVLDVTSHFPNAQRGQTILIVDTEAHSLKSDPGKGLAKNAAQSADLVEGGQLFLAMNGGAPVACAGDVTCDGTIDGADLADILGSWGACIGCAGDLNGDGTIDGVDLGIQLGGWGACP